MSSTGVNAIPAVAQPGAVPIPVGAGAAHARRCKSKRDKESATFILMHLDNEDLKDELSQPQFLQNGPEIFDHIRGGGGGGGGSGSSDGGGEDGHGGGRGGGMRKRREAEGGRRHEATAKRARRTTETTGDHGEGGERRSGEG